MTFILLKKNVIFAFVCVLLALSSGRSSQQQSLNPILHREHRADSESELSVCCQGRTCWGGLLEDSTTHISNFTGETDCEAETGHHGCRQRF